jgi:hypothetical protein
MHLWSTLLRSLGTRNNNKGVMKRMSFRNEVTFDSQYIELVSYVCLVEIRRFSSHQTSALMQMLPIYYCRGSQTVGLASTKGGSVGPVEEGVSFLYDDTHFKRNVGAR